ncbi:MAG: hypothetical protein ACE5NN_04335 [Candidatus Bathyarchaeia archaeon]
MRKEKIPLSIEEFSSGLTELLVSGVHPLERLLIQILCSKLQLEYDAKLGLSFTGHVQQLRKRFAG